MYRQRNIAFGVALVVAIGGGVAMGQEAPAPESPPAEAGSPEESTYLDLRRSKDRVTRLWAERYFTLTKLQEWGSAKGKKVKAKYVAHAPDLVSVTLEVAQGKEVTVPVAQLDKTSQSRVKQIAATQKKLDELLASGAKGEPEQPGADPNSDPGAPMVDERGEQPAPRRPATARRPARPAREEPAERPAATEQPLGPAESSTADDGNPDPLGFGELPANPVPVSPTGAQFRPPTGTMRPAGQVGDERLRAANSGNLQPNHLEEWRTDYEAFRALLTANASPEEPQASLSAIKELQAAADTMEQWEATGTVGEEGQLEIAAKLAEAGEFTWEATLTDAAVESGEWTDRLNLPPLPEPLAISFVLDEERDPGNWQPLKAGDRVKFVGRFVYFEGGDDLVAAIRFPDAAVGPTNARPAAASAATTR
jgi:hypothetical protein